MNEPKLCSLWDVWSNDLPGNFPKMEVVEALERQWSISKPNVYSRIKSGSLKNFVRDVSFLYTFYAIGFTPERGYFFDRVKYDLIQDQHEMEDAKMFNLSKSVS